MNAIDMCMTNMLTIQRFRTKNLWKRMSNNNNNKSHIMDELKHMSNSEKIEQKMEKNCESIAQMVHISVRSIISCCVLSRLCADVCCSMDRVKHFMLRSIRDSYCIFMDCLLH